jgi:hypothetical protein
MLNYFQHALMMAFCSFLRSTQHIFRKQVILSVLFLFITLLCSNVIIILCIAGPAFPPTAHPLEVPPLLPEGGVVGTAEPLKIVLWQQWGAGSLGRGAGAFELAVPC